MSEFREALSQFDKLYSLGCYGECQLVLDAIKNRQLTGVGFSERLALLFFQKGEYNKSVLLLKRAYKESGPLSTSEGFKNRSRILSRIAGCFLKQGFKRKAVIYYSVSVLFKPDYFDGYKHLNNLSVSFWPLIWRRYMLFVMKSIRVFLKHGFFDGYYQSLLLLEGRLCIERLNVAEAEKLFLKVLNINESSTRAWLWLGYVSLWSQQYEQSFLAYENAKTNGCDNGAADFGLIKCALEQGNLNEALVIFHGLPEDLKGSSEYSLILRELMFRQKKYYEAWQSFDRLKLVQLMSGVDDIPYKPVNMESLQDQSCLALAVWGPGDEIRWLSIYSELNKKIKNLMISCDPRLEGLLTRSFPDIVFKACVRSVRGGADAENGRYEELPFTFLSAALDDHTYQLAKNVDAVCLVPSFLQVLRSNECAFHDGGSALKPDPELVEYWARKLEGSLKKGSKKIGFCWKSGLIDLARSVHYIGIECWGDLFELDDVEFVSLQYADHESDVEFVKNEFGVSIHCFDGLDLKDDFEGLSALMSNLDLVVSPATFMIELAGALNVSSVMISNSSAVNGRISESGEQDLWYDSIAHPELLGSVDKRVQAKKVAEFVQRKISL